MGDDNEHQEQASPPALPDLLDNLPEEELAKSLRRRGYSSGSSLIAASWTGPLPPPAVLRDFNDIVDGSANQIIQMAVKEQDHRHAMEDKALSGPIDAEKRGQQMAFLLCAIMIIGTVVLVLRGHPVAGTAFGGATIVALAVAFLRGRTRDNGNQSDAD